MDSGRPRREYELLEMSTDAAITITELEWKRDNLSDEDLAPEFRRMYAELKKLNERSLREPLQFTDPKALFELVRYAKHLGMWKGYRENQGRLMYLGESETVTDGR